MASGGLGETDGEITQSSATMLSGCKHAEFSEMQHDFFYFLVSFD